MLLCYQEPFWYHVIFYKSVLTWTRLKQLSTLTLRRSWLSAFKSSLKEMSAQWSWILHLKAYRASGSGFLQRSFSNKTSSTRWFPKFSLPMVSRFKPRLWCSRPLRASYDSILLPLLYPPRFSPTLWCLSWLRIQAQTHYWGTISKASFLHSTLLGTFNHQFIHFVFSSPRLTTTVTFSRRAVTVSKSSPKQE